MRRCLLPPIPELELAAKLLDAAADALLAGYDTLAGELIAQANNPLIFKHAVRLFGPMTAEVHRQTRRPKTIDESAREETRMPSLSVQRAIFVRDGWRCRFCTTRVFSRKARRNLIQWFPKQTHWDAGEYARHTALYSMAASLDHVVPYSRGGSNDVSNFVTACYCCQCGRGEWTLEEMELIDPRSVAPVVDGWDGLSRLDRFEITRHPSPAL